MMCAKASDRRDSMAKLSTHVLDTAHGKPGQGITLRLFKIVDGRALLLKSAVTNADGRVDVALLQDQEFKAGRYRLEFDVAAYFRALSTPLSEPAFLEMVPIEFGVADSAQNYHIPLLLSPWSYSTYRGS
jgi:5-hydroxyisourate hydrolase